VNDRLQNNRFRKGLIENINTPLGFYVLALLIVEGFLCIVLTKGNLEAPLQATGMLAGIFLFLVVVVLVSIFVWFKPTHLIFSGLESLVDRGKIPYGTDVIEVPPEEMPKGEPSSEKED